MVLPVMLCYLWKATRTYLPPVTCNLLPVANYLLPATCYSLAATSCMLPYLVRAAHAITYTFLLLHATFYTRYMLSDKSFLLPTDYYNIPATGFLLSASCYQLPATCCMLPAFVIPCSFLLATCFLLPLSKLTSAFYNLQSTRMCVHAASCLEV